MRQPSVSLILPAYNEGERIARSLWELVEFSKSWRLDHEILVVVERSSDGTLEIARRALPAHPRIQIIDNVIHRGKGYAVRSGILRATKDLVFFSDIDLSTPLSEVPAFLEHFARHPQVDVLIGSRRHPETEIVKRQSLFRQTLGRIFNLLVRRVALGDVKDTQCGFKAFRRDAAQSIFTRQKLTGFAFDVEVLCLARRLGHEIDTRPVRWTNVKGSKVHIVWDSFAMFRDLVRTPWVVAATLRKMPAGSLPTDGVPS